MGEPPYFTSIYVWTEVWQVFAGAKRERRTPLLWEWRFRIVGHVLNRSPMLALRDGPWKLLVNPDPDRLELYHVPSDPMELDNRVRDERAQPARRLTGPPSRHRRNTLLRICHHVSWVRTTVGEV